MGASQSGGAPATACMPPCSTCTAGVWQNSGGGRHSSVTPQRLPPPGDAMRGVAGTPCVLERGAAPALEDRSPESGRAEPPQARESEARSSCGDVDVASGRHAADEDPRHLAASDSGSQAADAHEGEPPSLLDETLGERDAPGNTAEGRHTLDSAFPAFELGAATSGNVPENTLGEIIGVALTRSSSHLVQLGKDAGAIAAQPRRRPFVMCALLGSMCILLAVLLLVASAFFRAL